MGDGQDWVIKQIGLLIKETREYLLMASKFNPQMDTDNRFCGLQKIPKTDQKAKRNQTMISSLFLRSI
jgi:hypothetical protein